MDFNISTAEVLRVDNPLGSVSSVTIAPNSFFLSPNVIDVRGFASYYLEIDADTTGLVGTSMNAVEFRLLWLPDAKAVGTAIYIDTYAIWTNQNSAGGVFDCPCNSLYLQDNHHGPFFRLMMITPSSNTESVTVTAQYYASTRTLAGPYARQLSATQDGQNLTIGTDGILAFSGTPAIANGVTANEPCALGYGDVKMRLFAGAGALTYFFRYAGMTGAIETLNVAANTAILDQPLMVPKRALLVSPRNTSGVASSYQAFVKTGYNKF